MAAPNIHPIAPGNVRRVSTSLATANTARDGSGTITTLLTAGDNGSVVPSIRVRSIEAAGASTPNVARLWHQNAGTGTWYLIDEVAIPTATPSTTVVGAAVVFNLTNIVLSGKVPGSASGADKLGITVGVSAALAFSADVGDY